MAKTPSFKRLILRAVLRQVSPMVNPPGFGLRSHAAPGITRRVPHYPRVERRSGLHHSCAWSGFNSFRRKTRSKALHEFKLHRQEKFLYVCDTLHMWEWDVRVLDIQERVEGDQAPVCVGGRGAAPPEFCGGPTGYRLMLKRQREGAAMSDPVRLEAGVQMLAEACPGQSATNLGPAPHHDERGLSEHRSKTARTRTSAT